MNVPFHYSVKIKLFNYHSKDKIELIEPRPEEFFDENPISAREKAFSKYQSWLDILLQKQGKEYSTDRQAREDLQAYLNLNVTLEGNEFDLSNSVSFGIGVYFVIDIPRTWEIYNDDSLNDHSGDEDLIHGIGNASQFNDPSSFAFHLENEFEYYCNNDYKYKDYNREASCYSWIDEEVTEFEYLETPFDWTGLDAKPEEEIQVVTQNTTERIEQIIANGEGEVVEFKPTLSYHFNHKTWQGKYEVNYKIAKAICAFLNSKGGLLFIGIKDNSEIQGLDFDFKLSDRENKRDFFKCEFDRVLDTFLGFSIKPIVNGDFLEVNGKTIFIIKIEPSKTPVSLKAQENKKEFWVRGNASNRQLSDPEEIINYWLNRDMFRNNH